MTHQASIAKTAQRWERPPGRPLEVVFARIIGSLDGKPKRNAGHTLVLVKHDAAFFGGLRVGRTRTPDAIYFTTGPVHTQSAGVR